MAMSSPATAIERPQRWNSALYADRGRFVADLAADLVDLLAPTSGERILDVGAGDGALTARIAAHGARVTGLDASTSMIDAARAVHPDLDWVVGDGQALAYDSAFDAVFSNAALHWMPRARDVADGVFRALVPGGRFVAEFGGAGCVRTVIDAAHDSLRRMNAAPERWLRWYFPTLAEYAAVLEAAGLSVHAAWLFDRPTLLAGDGGLRDWFGLFAAPLLADLGPRRDDFLGNVENLTASALRRSDGWVLDYVRLRVVARRPR
jgi:trans-aconitate methyltransferase